MASSLTDSPADVLRSIFHYLSLPDIIRFGMTAKNMFNNMWPYYQEIEIDRDWPIEAHLFVLSQELSHVCNLELTHRIDMEHRSYKERIVDFEKGINSLATSASTLTNLHSFIVNIATLHGEQEENILTSVQGLVASLTQLQSLHWHSSKVANIGQFLSCHTRLTYLGTPWAEKDEAFSEVMDLTRLINLDIVYENNVSDASFTKISNLTNLEHLRMEHTSKITSASFNALFKMPKLYSLVVEYPRDDNQGELTDDLSIFGRLSQLTNLGLRNTYSNSALDMSLITGLTNLLQLSIETKIQNADFSAFTKLTHLTANSSDDERDQLSNLPISLRELFVFRCKLDNGEIEMICGLTNLQNLMLSDKLDSIFLANRITRLTNITDLTFRQSLPIEVIPALRNLPLLMHLDCPKLTEENIIELALLTQLQELVYWEATDGNKEKLQQSVSYKVRCE